jgi:hypothetical protein
VSLISEPVSLLVTAKTITSVPYMEMEWGLEGLSSNSCRTRQVAAIETSRKTPHCATLPRDIYKIRKQNTTHVAVNTILGKGDKSILAYYNTAFYVPPTFVRINPAARFPCTLCL